MTITQFDKNNLSVVRQKLQSALNAAALEMGLTVQLGNIRYTANSFSTKLECKTAATTEGKVNLQNADNAMLQMYGLELGKQIMINGDKKTITGFNSKARKNKVIITDANGTQFITSVDTAKRCLIA